MKPHTIEESVFATLIIIAGSALGLFIAWLFTKIAEGYIKLMNWLYMNSKHLILILSTILLTSCAYVTKYECQDNDPFGDSQLDDPEYNHDKFLERNNFKRQLPNTKFA